MATVKFSTRTKSNPTKIYCRFINGRNIDFVCPMNLLVNPKYWDPQNEKIKNVIAVKNRSEINRKLALLKIEIIDNFNMAYMSGEVIDKPWLNGVV